MILVWHNIGKKPQGENTVSLKAFHAQLKSIQLAGGIVVPLSAYNPQNPRHIVLQFDDGCADLRLAIPVLKKYNFVFEVFVVGDWFGRPGYMGPQDIPYIVANGGRLQWHTKSHTDLTAAADVAAEMQVPAELRRLDPLGFNAVAYPYWKTNQMVEDVASRYFRYGCSGNGFAGGSALSLDAIKMKENSRIQKTEKGLAEANIQQRPSFLGNCFGRFFKYRR